MKKVKAVFSFVLFLYWLVVFFPNTAEADLPPEPEPLYIEPGIHHINPPICVGCGCSGGYYDEKWVDFNLPPKAVYRKVRFFVRVYWFQHLSTYFRFYNKYGQVLWEGYTIHLAMEDAIISTDVARLWTYPCGDDYMYVLFDSLEFIETEPDYMQKSFTNEFKFELRGNYPNPFNTETQIEYTVAYDGYVVLSVYNLLGQKIRILVDEYQTAGYKTIHWDGKDDQGKEIASGVYFYKIQAGDFTQTRKMVLMK